MDKLAKPTFGQTIANYLLLAVALGFLGAGDAFAQGRGNNSGLRQEMEGLQAALAATQSDLAAMQAALVATQSDLATTQTALVTTQGDLATTQTALVTTQGDLATTQAALVTAQGDLATTQSDLVTTQADLSAADTRIGILENAQVAWHDIQGIPKGFADGVDNNTQLSEAQVDGFTADNGYLLSVLWDDIQGVPADIADGDDGGSSVLDPFVSLVEDDIDGLAGPHIMIVGANVHVRSGVGATDDGGILSGLGNLIVGYNAPGGFGFPQRAGSHNLVVGDEHDYTSHGGFVAGFSNAITAPCASVSGGHSNLASGMWSSVSGGGTNEASGPTSSVSGGQSNLASGAESSISGGSSSTSSGEKSTVSGGTQNTASAIFSTASGGFNNTASGVASHVP
jgi:hypothetical protein